MPIYSYTARDVNNKTVKGTMPAENLQNARIALEKMNLKTDEIHETTISEKKETDQSISNSDKFFEPYDKVPIHNGNNNIYFPIVDTLRLYAGWLLVGYVIAYFLGSYQITKNLPFEIPYVNAFLYSNLILQFTLACFLFLFAGSVHKFIKGKTFSAIILTIISIGIFVFVHINL